MIIKVDAHNTQISISDYLLDLYSVKLFGRKYKEVKKKMNIKIRDIYKKNSFSCSKDVKKYIEGEILVAHSNPNKQ